MTSVCWACGIRTNGFFGWLKGFSEPIAVMLPMNIVSEIAQPISMAFRHFGNIAGGGVLPACSIPRWPPCRRRCWAWWQKAWWRRSSS